ncbi:hypothetical protein ABHI18_003599 [Aspergillus niger]
MSVRDTVLLLVSVGRFSCFGYGGRISTRVQSASLREYDIFFRTSIEGACSGSLRGSCLLQSQTSAAILFEERLVFFFCSLVPDVCRYPFEGVVYLSRYRVSLREFDGLLVLVPALFEGLVALSQPLSPSGVRFILADIGDVSLREFDGLLNLVFSERIWSSTSCSSSLRESGLQPLAVSPRESGLLLVCACADSLREFRLVIFSIDRLKPPPPSVSVSPPPSMFAMSQPEIADRFPSPLKEARIPLFAGLSSEYLVSEGRQVYRRNIFKQHNIWKLSAIKND